MKNYYRVMLGQKSLFAEECFAGNFIGADFDIGEDLTDRLPESWRDFNHSFIPVYLANHPSKSRIAAGLACGFLHTVAKGIVKDDRVLCPDGKGLYRVGDITGDYFFAAGQNLPHRRPVRWLNVVVNKSDMSEGLRGSSGSSGTVCNLSRSGHHEELERLVEAESGPVVVSTDPLVEDPSSFALEQHLEAFLVQNWVHTELGQRYDIYADDSGTGQQFKTDTGFIDVLAVSKDGKELLVVELKKGRASDAVVGQIQRYMGYVQEELAEDGQVVRGVIIAHEDDLRIRRALKVAPSISFLRYQLSFKLVKS